MQQLEDLQKQPTKNTILNLIYTHNEKIWIHTFFKMHLQIFFCI